MGEDGAPGALMRGSPDLQGKESSSHVSAASDIQPPLLWCPALRAALPGQGLDPGLSAGHGTSSGQGQVVGYVCTSGMEDAPVCTWESDTCAHAMMGVSLGDSGTKCPEGNERAM